MLHLSNQNCFKINTGTNLFHGTLLMNLVNIESFVFAFAEGKNGLGIETTKQQTQSVTRLQTHKNKPIASGTRTHIYTLRGIRV